MKIGVMTGGAIDTLGIDKGFEAIKNAGFEVVDFNLDTYFIHRYNMNEEIIAKHRDEEAFRAYVDEVRTAAKKYGRERLDEIISSLAEVDAASKYGGVTGYTAVELFIARNL